MKVDYIEESAVRKALTFEVEAERVQAEIDTRARDLARKVKLPGFRPGKVPVEVVKRRFKDEILGEAAEAIVNKVVFDELDGRGLKPLAPPKVEEVKLEDGQPMTFKAVFETLPLIELPDWKGLHIPEKTSKGMGVEVGNNPQNMPGDEGTYQSYGVPWANVSNTPFRAYKGSCYEGGIAVPLVTVEPVTGLAIHSCVAMGASIGMAAGAAHAGYTPAVAAIGDSTFSHGGITPLLSAVQQHVNLNVLILDNDTVGMTGTQRSMSTGRALDDLVQGTGVDPSHIRVIEPTPRNHDENVRIMREELAYDGPSVIIARRSCLEAIKHSPH